jgi:hypothetical protein
VSRPAAAREARASPAGRLLIGLGIFMLFGCVMMAVVLLPFEREVGFTWVTAVLVVDALAGFGFVTVGLLKIHSPAHNKH